MNPAKRFDATPWLQAGGPLQLPGRQPDPAAERLPISLRRRRGFTPQMEDPRASVSLHDDDGLLRWVYQPPPLQQARGRVPRAGRGRAGGWAGVAALGRALLRLDYDDIGPNQVSQALAALDKRLSGPTALQQWQPDPANPAGRWADVAPGPRPGRCLLLVHGTFSSNRMWLQQLAETAAGRELLARWVAAYPGGVLAFNHPTLSVAPWLNALDLHGCLAGPGGPGGPAAPPGPAPDIDIVCHSRGGLVVSWLLRLTALPVRHVCLVGSPLHGTSLASPHRLRLALDMLANMANALQLAGLAASAVFPLAAGAAGLAQALGQTLQLGARLPVADAAVALVPGLASQQRITDHAETARLFARAWQTQPQLTMVTSNFEPNLADPAWKFWTRLRRPALQAANLAADALFPGDNDLVVDTASMTELGALVPGPHAVLALGANPRVFHTNYFTQADVLQFIAAQTLGPGQPALPTG